jgi:hypothetical protein
MAKGARKKAPVWATAVTLARAGLGAGHHRCLSSLQSALVSIKFIQRVLSAVIAGDCVVLLSS